MPVRVYQTSRLMPKIVGIAFVAGGLFFLVAFCLQGLSAIREASFLEVVGEVVVPLLLLVVGSFSLFCKFRRTVSLSDTTIEVSDRMGTVSLRLDQIEGRRRYVDPGDDVSPNVVHLVLVPNDDRIPRMDIEKIYNFDEAFYAWFNGLPDLDERDKKLRTPPVTWGGSIPT